MLPDDGANGDIRDMRDTAVQSVGNKAPYLKAVSSDIQI